MKWFFPTDDDLLSILALFVAFFIGLWVGFLVGKI
jgi:hypothetical protein